jgi:hypothetical protein
MLPFEYPVPLGSDPQVWRERVNEIADQIVLFFQDNLPSNYVSTVDGPQYRMHWRNLAIALATIQVQALEVVADQTDQTRGEFIHQLWGKLLLPGGMPTLDSDQALRDFLRDFAPLLLAGATRDAIEQAVQLLVTNATVQEAEDYTFDVTLEGANNTFGSSNPVLLEQNVRLLIDALRPAHTVYRLRHLFRETLSQPVDTVGYPNSRLTVSLSDEHYDDARSFWAGVESIGSVADVSGRWLNDYTTDLSFVQVGAPVTLEGETYRVVSVRRFKQELDLTPRAFTSPAGNGFVTVEGDELTSDIDLVHATWGDVLTITTGANAGKYRLESLSTGHLDDSPPSSFQTRPAVGWLELDRAAPNALGVAYRLGVDRLGRQKALQAVEDVSSQFAI